MPNPPSFSLVITGEWPGAGQSTTAKLVAEKLNFARIYAGSLFRKFAHVWNLEKKTLSWTEFENRAKTNTLNLDTYSFNENQFNEATPHAFQHQLRIVNTPEVWDKIIDTHSLISLKKPGVIVEAKVGVLLDHTGLGSFKGLKHRVYKILLTCPPEISAHRVIKRKIENGEIEAIDQDHEQYLALVRTTTTEIIERHLRDWERYEKIYGIYRSDIYKRGIMKVNTAAKTEAQVADTVIDIINHFETSKKEPAN